MGTKVTLSIDFGYKNIGVALARNEEGTNTPLFAGTILYDPFQLSTAFTRYPNNWRGYGKEAGKENGRQLWKRERFKLLVIQRA